MIIVQTSEFKEGDLVHLTSGSPRMVVTFVDEETKHCTVLWNVFGTGTIQTSEIPFIALRKHT